MSVVAIDVVVALLLLAGVVGSVLPLLPGTPLILGGALLHAFATDWSPLGPGRLVILAALMALSFLLAHLGAAVGARKYGASRLAMMGALIGAVVGVFLGPLGLLVGPFAGAVLGELLHGRDVTGSLRSGTGALLGMVVGVAGNFVVALVMVGLTLWWLWRG